MKKVILSLALAYVTAFAANGGFADAEQNHSQKGGFVDNAKISVMSVKEALNARDDTRAVLRGKIVREIKHEKYEFTDGKSRILAEIDDKIWQGLVVTPNDFVEIEGYIDNDPFERTEIEVYRIIKLK
ncbi:MAG: YgiW/YdeI family stress tolerance OB fold protein [Campylobacter sp.]|nr:YgiW/YdeI family stress tolerance OB fold protein [Campylobacter sp.]